MYLLPYSNKSCNYNGAKLIKDRNVERQFKSLKTSEVFGVDRVVTIIWVMLSIFNISIL